MSEQMNKIFISYRRDDSAATCGRIYDRLTARFGREAVFKDVDSIPYGVDFSRYIDGFLRQCAVQLVIIGPQWLDIQSRDATRRLEQPSDLVRLEIEGALGLGIPIIPVLVQGAEMPLTSRLPESLQGLVRYHGLTVRYDPDFDADMRRLFTAIEYWIGQRLGEQRQSPSPASSSPPPGHNPTTAEYRPMVQIRVPPIKVPASLKTTSPWAIWSLICGIAVLFTIGIGAIPAVIFGHMALRQLKEKPELQGRGMAITGLVIGYATIALAILVGLVEVIFVVYQLSSH